MRSVVDFIPECRAELLRSKVLRGRQFFYGKHHRVDCQRGSRCSCRRMRPAQGFRC